MLLSLIGQGLPALIWQSWAIIAWRAVVNTAFAFTLWNLTLRTLSATESSIINNVMLIQIPICVIWREDRLSGADSLTSAIHKRRQRRHIHWLH
jgi:drug/metabolite transporter (DMT)-like permease